MIPLLYVFIVRYNNIIIIQSSSGSQQQQQQRQTSLSGSSDTSSLSPKPTDKLGGWDEADSGTSTAAASPTKPTSTPLPGGGDVAARAIQKFLATRYEES